MSSLCPPPPSHRLSGTFTSSVGSLHSKAVITMNAAGISKRCRVCGDIALGFNFNGLSCESCKAFFRRNAFAQKPFICKKEKNCTVEKLTRKKCKYCRLQKCFEIGMKKELIAKYKNNITECVQDNLLVPQHYYNEKELSMKVSSNGGITMMPFYEKQRLLEIQAAMEKEFYDDRQLTVVGRATVMNDAMNLAGHYVNNICKFLKHIPEFTCLQVTDQVELLKSFFFDICAARFAFTYDAAIDGFPIAENAAHDRVVIFPMSILDQWRNGEATILFRRYHSAVAKEMENDSNIRDLVIVRSLFAKKPNAKFHEFMRYYYHVFNRLLKMYLFEKYQNVEMVEQKYNTLMAIVREGESLRPLIAGIYADMPPTQIEPVIAELYNLL